MPDSVAQAAQASALTWCGLLTAPIRPREAHGMVRSQAAAVMISVQMPAKRAGSRIQ